ncbi:DUF3347 domain-containing protein [Galbibacter sp.]|jgi:hypothetical protein|uniref:DUF3347 domain-containing protein n=1 Tax=Galbibacter sp. TaxID=2918471 RepID=UPI003A8D7554
MKYLKVNLGILLLLISSLSLTACNTESKKSEAVAATDKVNSEVPQPSQATQIIAQYLVLKDALVGDNTDATKQAGEKLTAALSNFKLDQFKGNEKSKLTQILADSKLSARQISDSDIAQQREQFLSLSANMIELVAITGATQKLYQQYCPMYNNNKGGTWLSAHKEVKNPYFGSSMLTCGVVQREI